MDFSLNLQGKVAVITGGTGVLGSTMVKSLAKEGVKVVVLGRDRGKMDKLVEEVTADNGEILAIQCDVLDKEGLVKAREEIVEKYSTIDILINGAGGNRKTATTGP